MFCHCKQTNIQQLEVLRLQESEDKSRIALLMADINGYSERIQTIIQQHDLEMASCRDLIHQREIREQDMQYHFFLSRSDLQVRVSVL